MKALWKKILNFVQEYPVIVAALVIYGYYLLTSIDLFSHKQKESFVDYFIRFDSLFFLWIAAAAWMQVMRLKKARHEDEKRRLELERTFDRQQIHEQIVQDITELLQDNVNNPLAIISVTSREIRKRFEADDDIIRWLDRIDGSIHRIHNTIRDLQTWETGKILKETSDTLKDKTQQ
jgi:signal transduction histidine kinase